jgi:hypothetical protein
MKGGFDCVSYLKIILIKYFISNTIKFIETQSWIMKALSKLNKGRKNHTEYFCLQQRNSFIVINLITIWLRYIHILDFFYPKLEDSTWDIYCPIFFFWILYCPILIKCEATQLLICIYLIIHEHKSIFLWSFDKEGYFSDE